ncbi:hypothetical protein BC941DRAFT_447807 [Chlamydoabsidia padenii]|nr:hypothetical protein BC941DRAFT_447807 [Chlamydoabsidia padenii]
MYDLVFLNKLATESRLSPNEIYEQSMCLLFVATLHICTVKMNHGNEATSSSSSSSPPPRKLRKLDSGNFSVGCMAEKMYHRLLDGGSFASFNDKRPIDWDTAVETFKDRLQQACGFDLAADDDCNDDTLNDLAFE